MLKNHGIWTEKTVDGAPHYYNAAGVEWYQYFEQPENQSAYYLVLDDMGAPNMVVCCEKDWQFIQCAGKLVIGMDSIAPYKCASELGKVEGRPKEAIYFYRIDLYTGAILPRPLPNLSAKQIRLWLLKRGELGNVDKVIAGFGSPFREQAQVEWQYGSSFERDSEFIKDLAAAMGWTDDWLDAEWANAAEIE